MQLKINQWKCPNNCGPDEGCSECRDQQKIWLFDNISSINWEIAPGSHFYLENVNPKLSTVSLTDADGNPYPGVEETTLVRIKVSRYVPNYGRMSDTFFVHTEAFIQNDEGETLERLRP